MSHATTPVSLKSNGLYEAWEVLAPYPTREEHWRTTPPDIPDHSPLITTNLRCTIDIPNGLVLKRTALITYTGIERRGGHTTAMFAYLHPEVFMLLRQRGMGVRCMIGISRHISKPAEHPEALLIVCFFLSLDMCSPFITLIVQCQPQIFLRKCIVMASFG